MSAIPRCSLSQVRQHEERFAATIFIESLGRVLSSGSGHCDQCEVLNLSVNTVYVGTGYQHSQDVPRLARYLLTSGGGGQEWAKSVLAPHTGHAGYIYTSSPLSSPCHHYLHRHDHITIIIIMTTLS